MSPIVEIAGLAGLGLIAAFGILAGYRRRDVVAVEPAGDPLQDLRASLFRSLADLEEARASGALEDDAYRRLRRDTDRRLARLLRAIDERRRDPSLPARSRASAAPSTPGPEAAGIGRGVPTWAVAALLVGTVGAASIGGLAGNAEPANSGATSASGGDPLAFFEERVRDHPADLAARLDLAHRYLDAMRIEDALAQYRVVLEIDPKDAEANAHVGLILFLAHRPGVALRSVERALETAPGYPEALFLRGWILLDGLHRPAEAIRSLERYLAATPFGAERADARRLLGLAREALRAG